MPIWELNVLLEQLRTYLPHILYGVEGAAATRKASEKPAGFNELVNQPVGGMA